MALVPGHVIFNTATLAPPYEQLVLVYTLTSISVRWRPVTDHTFKYELSSRKARISSTDIAPAVVERLAYQNFVFRDVQHVSLTLHRSPLHDDGYKIIVYVSDRSGRESQGSFADTLLRGLRLTPLRASGAMLFTYHISVSPIPPSALRWSRASAVSAVPDLYAPEISCTGYTVNHVDGRVIDAHLPQSQHAWRDGTPGTARDVGVTGGGNYSVHLSASTGAVSFFTEPHVHIVSYV